MEISKEQKEAIEELEDFIKGPCETCKYCKSAYKLNRKNIIQLLNLNKKLQKENEELKQDRNNNYQMIALAQNEVLGYMQGYEDGKKLKRSAVACVVENQQYYIIKEEIERYKEYIEKLQKENEELKSENRRLKVIRYSTEYGTENIHLITKSDLVEINTNKYFIEIQDGKFVDLKQVYQENEELKEDLKYVLNQTLGAFEKNWCIDWNFTEIREKYNLESE